jgi:NAD(P)-dependent dehydrogenase (short-subunit alcohol dehydrogenase family)
MKIDRVFVFTGASGGIGALIAKRFLATPTSCGVELS